MTAGSPSSGDRLVCGSRVDELLEQVAAGLDRQHDPHQAGCPHCQAALAEYARLWAPVRELAATEVRAPDSLLENALARIRGTASDPDYGVVPGPHGATRIAARVVVVLARETAQDVAGVRVALSRLVTTGVTDADGAPGAGTGATRVVAGVAGRSTAVDIVLAADFGIDLIALGDRIRAEVGTRVRELTGLEPVAVSVRIDDVFG